MYLRILLKDIKRKKTMNVILLLFVILSAMFAASSVNNIVSIIGGIDKYLDKAGVPDYMIIDLGKNDIEGVLEGQSSVKSYRIEHGVMCFEDNFLRDGERLLRTSDNTCLLSIDDAKLKYFDRNDQVITEVPEGSAYMSSFLARNSGLKKGDSFELKIGSKSLRLTYAGIAKDALLGSSMANIARCILNPEDFAAVTAGNDAVTPMNIYYIDTDDITALKNTVSEIPDVSLSADRELIRTTYFMNLVVAGMLLFLSVCLILISFVVLRFTIGFTISEEFREIGVMKAMGLKNSSIRGLYLVKYIGIAAVGAVIGFIASIPFGRLLLDTVSDSMVLTNGNEFLIGILCSIAVVLIIIGFCWRSTAKIRKLSPVDAVRCGQTGERFRKRSIMQLGNSRLGTTGFLAANDVISSPKQSCIITTVFTICTLLVMILVNTVNTACSSKMLPILCITESDLYTHSVSMMNDVVTEKKTVSEVVEEAERRLAENGIPGEVRIERLKSLSIRKGDRKLISAFQWSKETKTTSYTYSRGTAPLYPNEIAMTFKLADELDAGIGDTVNVTINGEERDFIITGLYQSLNNLGENARFNENIDISDTGIANCFDMQITFDDHPGKAELNRRIDLVNEIFDTDDTVDTSGFVDRCLGVREIFDSVKLLTLVLTVIIVIMISILMERSFIAREKSEIALMKALGFKSRAVILQHTLRFALMAAVSVIIAALLCRPLTKLTMDPIIGIAGASEGVSYEIKAFEIFVVYPLIIVSAAVIGSMLTAFYTRTIKASDTADIE